MKYTVTVAETVTYEAVVTAPNEALARAFGDLRVSEATRRLYDYIAGVHEIDCKREISVEPKRDERSERLIGEADDLEVVREPDGDDAA